VQGAAEGFTADVGRRLSRAAELLGRGQAADASRELTALLAQTPDNARAWFLLAHARGGCGDLRGAEEALKRSLSIDPRTPDAGAALGDLYRQTNRPQLAEQAYRDALKAEPASAAAAGGLGRLLLAANRPSEAAEAMAAAAAAPSAPPDLLQIQAAALKSAGRLEDALTFNRKAVEAAPRDALAEHNLAATLGDLELREETEQAARRALAKGLDAPETWLILARAQLGQGRGEDAEASLRQAIRRRPAYDEAQRELAQLVWMRTEDLAAASAELVAALRTQPQAQGLRIALAKLMEFAGDLAGAQGVLDPAAKAPGADPFLLASAAQLASHTDPEAALALAQRAVRAREDPRLLAVLCEAQLAAGRAAEADETARQWRQIAPDDQHAIALQATAWRILGDDRYRRLYDYDAFVRAWRLDTPPGWSDLDAYLADLAASLERLHHLRAHPVGQSLRHGSQTSQSLKRLDDPAVKGFFAAIDGPIRRHMAALAQVPDPLGRPAPTGYDIRGIWSVRLRGEGFHVDHVHPQGWLSSACYVALPQAVDAGDKQGWIKFGEPGAVTRPVLGPEHFVKPEAGVLVLFPSYMWHGTVPFRGDDHRLTVAFDVTPA
jgi:tetratricopeptide (TPR) repeat protein